MYEGKVKFEKHKIKCYGEKKKGYFTCAITRMIKRKVGLKVTHLSLEHAYVVICGSIRRTHGLFIGRAIVYADASRVIWAKRFTNGEVVARDIDARVKI